MSMDLEDEVVEELDVYYCNKEALGAQVDRHATDSLTVWLFI